ncbi:MAG: hypothetical protein LUO93_03070 [Methanomicrobiales archaeon]|nr:hypothetical protein [Methanomicrobiales archaeon]
MGSETAYLTIMGRYTWALLNSYYAVLRGTSLRPTVIYVFSEEIFRDQVETVKKGLALISEAYDVQPEIHVEMLASSNIQDACQKIPKTVHDLKARGFQVALDITPGRKALITGALLSSRDDLDHVYYLAISSVEDADKPYMMIPLLIQDLKDFKEAIVACERGM